MTKIKIEKPHGYLLDNEGNVIIRFGNWRTGYHNVPDSVESVEYVDGPSGHDKEAHEDYKKD